MKWLTLLIVILISACTNNPIIDPIDPIDPIHEPCNPPVKECNYEPARIHLPGEMQFGKVTGLKNCVHFEASAQAGFQNVEDPKIGVLFNTYEKLSGAVADKEFFSITAKAQGSPMGKWPLIIDTLPNLRYNAYYLVHEFHLAEDYYYIDNNYEHNYIEFCEIDSFQNKIYGTFEARFIIESSRPSGKNPDTILFSNCHFEAWHPE